MQSSGGVAAAEEAARAGAWSVLSGPAGGAVGAGLLARRQRRRQRARLRHGRHLLRRLRGRGRRGAANRLARGSAAASIQLPMVDVHTVGAGGGSIGWRDPGGALRVGPRSAGAEPGPACYGRGGTEPTVTDANLLLGYLAADSTPGRRRRARRRRGRAPPSAALAGLARPRRAGDRGGDRPGRQPGDGAGAARGHGRARRRPAPLRAAAVRRRRPDARGGDRRRARDRAHPLPARRRRPLRARPLRLGPPPRHHPHRDAERRRARAPSASPPRSAS